MSASQIAPYQTLAGMIERELELVGDGRFDELERLQAAREALVATLPATPPACARAALERCALMQQRVTIEALRRREAVLLALAKVERARRAARGYAPARTRTPRVSASA